MADEGATPRELVLEACRRNNTDLLQEYSMMAGADVVEEDEDERRDGPGSESD